MSGNINRKGVRLNDLERQIIESIYNKETTVRACINRILGTLFSGGIQLSDEKSAIAQVRADFKEHLHEHWVPFACETILNFILFGFSAYIISKKRHPETRRVIKYPTVVPFDRIDVRIHQQDDYQIKYKIFKKQNSYSPQNIQEEDKRVKLCFYENCTRPSTKGNFRSAMANLMESIENMDELTEYALRSESYLSHPTLFIQAVADNRKFEEISSLAAFESDDIQEARNMRRDKKTMDAYDAMQSSYNQAGLMDRSPPVYSTRTGRMLPSHTKVWKNNIFAVPDGYVLSNNVPPPQTKQDIDKMKMQLQETICAVLGVPRSILHNDMSHSSAGVSDLAARQYRRTVDGYRNAILIALNNIYSTIYGDDHDDLLSIPGVPLLTVESVLAVYERGVIGPEKMAKFMCAALNISENDIDESRVEEFDQYFKQQLQVEMQQAETNVAATAVGSSVKREADREAGKQSLSKKVKIEMERTSKTGSNISP